MAQPLFPNLQPVLPDQVYSPAFSLSGLKMADKKDNHGRKTSMGLNTATKSRQEITGPVLLQVSLAFLLKLGRYYEIRPLSRPLNFP